MNMRTEARRKTLGLVRAVRMTAAEQGRSAAIVLVVRKGVQAGVRLVSFAGEWLVDLRYGIRTRGFLDNRTTLNRSAAFNDSNHYQAISVRGFRGTIRSAEVVPATHAFVDLGCGRGRAMLLAAEQGFARVIGVELDPRLVEEARANVRRWQQRHPAMLGRPELEVREGDAAQTDFLHMPLLVWLYNSFGPDTLRAVLERLIDSWRSAPRPITLCYFNPVHADVVAEFPTLEIHQRGSGWTVYRVR